MNKQIQFFQIANLIFSIPENSTLLLNSGEIAEIQKRFQSIIKSFAGSKSTNYATNYIKQDGSNLPYTSMTILGEINNHLILHFTFSYNEPVLFVIDTKTNTARNYIDINSAKGILQDDIYEDIKDELSFPKNMNRLFKNISDINQFVAMFQTVLHEHDNPDAITGRDCFELELDDFGDR